MQILLLILSFALGLTLLVLGYLYGRHEALNKEYPQSLLPTVPELKQTLANIKRPLTKEEPSGIITRPTVEELNKRNENPLTSGEKEALNDTFIKDPVLAKLKEDYERMQNL